VSSFLDRGEGGGRRWEGREGSRLPSVIRVRFAHTAFSSLVCSLRRGKKSNVDFGNSDSEPHYNGDSIPIVMISEGEGLSDADFSASSECDFLSCCSFVDDLSSTTNRISSPFFLISSAIRSRSLSLSLSLQRTPPLRSLLRRLPPSSPESQRRFRRIQRLLTSGLGKSQHPVSGFGDEHERSNEEARSEPSLDDR